MTTPYPDKFTAEPAQERAWAIEQILMNCRSGGASISHADAYARAEHLLSWVQGRITAADVYGSVTDAELGARPDHGR
jgi:hypothetical protein